MLQEFWVLAGLFVVQIPICFGFLIYEAKPLYIWTVYFVETIIAVIVYDGYFGSDGTCVLAGAAVFAGFLFAEFVVKPDLYDMQERRFGVVKRWKNHASPPPADAGTATRHPSRHRPDEDRREEEPLACLDFEEPFPGTFLDIKA